jgi:hypothetical protein
MTLTDGASESMDNRTWRVTSQRVVTLMNSQQSCAHGWNEEKKLAFSSFGIVARDFELQAD